MRCGVETSQREVTHEEVIKEMSKGREWVREVGASDGVRDCAKMRLEGVGSV